VVYATARHALKNPNRNDVLAQWSRCEQERFWTSVRIRFPERVTVHLGAVSYRCPDGRRLRLQIFGGNVLRDCLALLCPLWGRPSFYPLTRCAMSGNGCAGTSVGSDGRSFSRYGLEMDQVLVDRVFWWASPASFANALWHIARRYPHGVSCAATRMRSGNAWSASGVPFLGQVRRPLFLSQVFRRRAPCWCKSLLHSVC